MSAISAKPHPRTTLPALLVLATLLCVPPHAPALQDPSPATQPDAPAPVWSVAGVIDERTLRLTGDGGELELRLLGVAQPEREADRSSARAWLENLLLGESVVVSDLTRPGSAPRSATYGFAWRMPERTSVNLEMIRQGYAPAAAKPLHERKTEFEAAELKARHAGRGIWRPTEPAAAARPAAARSPSRPPASKPAPPGEVVLVFVTESGEKYHLQKCRHASGARAIPLSDARQKYQPCSVCKPPK